MRSRSRCSVALATILLFLSAAAPKAQEVRIPAQDRILDFRPSMVYAVGKDDGNSWEVFSQVGQVAFDAADRLYVLDQGNHRVVVFDPSGRYVRQFGARGGGPGEMTSPGGMTVTADGQVVVLDFGRRAFSVFSREGRFLRSVPFRSNGILGATIQPHPTEGIIVDVAPLPGAIGGKGPSLVWYSLRPDRGPVTLVEVPQNPSAARRSSTSHQVGGAKVAVSSRIAFVPRLRWGALRTGGVAFSYSPAYSIRLAGSRGATRAIVRPIAPRKVTAQDMRLEKQRQLAELGENSTMPAIARQALQQQVEQLEFAEQIPVIEGLAADASGRLWIERAGPRVGAPGPIDLLTPDGRYLGTLRAQRLPSAFSRSGLMAFVERDDLGVERVAVRRIPRLPG